MKCMPCSCCVYITEFIAITSFPLQVDGNDTEHSDSTVSQVIPSAAATQKSRDTKLFVRCDYS